MSDQRGSSCCTLSDGKHNGVFAIYQILLGWKTRKYCYETVELPNPRPTQPKKNQVKSGIWATFPHGKYFSWVGVGSIQETDYNKPNPTKLCANTLLIIGDR